MENDDLSGLASAGEGRELTPHKQESATHQDVPNKYVPNKYWNTPLEGEAEDQAYQQLREYVRLQRTAEDYLQTHPDLLKLMRRDGRFMPITRQ